MPTQHVKPCSTDTLQEIANALLKARKIVVVTGAGISTNSGIPDFRSENGLYSLIQAQFDSVSQVRQLAPALKPEAVQDEDDRPAKRRRLSDGGEPDLPLPLTLPPAGDDAAGDDTATRKHDLDALEPAPIIISTPRPKLPLACAIQLATSPLSSPPSEEFMIPPSAFRPHTHRRLADVSRAVDSSPLSSPPPVLFDPFQLTSPCSDSSRRSSTTASEVEENTTALPAAGASQPGRINLPNMKGKDLFDASIWADPTRTSVFYQFATSLRQKVKEAEPTSSHKFISHLRDRGKLVRCYTQNIDQIEEKVGLSTSLQDGPGSRGRFSRRTAVAGSLNRVEEASGDLSESDKPQQGNEASQSQASQSQASQSQASQQASQSQASQPDDAQGPPSGTSCDGGKHEEESGGDGKAAAKRDDKRSGVECVFLHGSLELLRCFQCGRVCSWDDDDRELETLSGQQPECPHCVGATEARRERGKRALGVGKLRPDIVLYGEEHPNAHLISPIVTHDLALYPDMLLILGTSLRVHGLKIMVREFAKTVHSRGGRVVFVNFTKPPESSWGEIIDYWVEWDCDAWVADLQMRIPKLWEAPEVKPVKKGNPVALRDTKFTGAYCTLKIIRELHRITRPFTAAALPASGMLPSAASSTSPSASSSSSSSPSPSIPSHTASSLPGPSECTNLWEPEVAQAVEMEERLGQKSTRGKRERKPRPSSTLNPNHGRGGRKEGEEEMSSILHSVKSNPRIRKRKMMYGEVEVAAPAAKLPPLRPERREPRVKPQPIELPRPACAPLAMLSVNMRAAMRFARPEAFYLEDPLVKLAPQWPGTNEMQQGQGIQGMQGMQQMQGIQPVVVGGDDNPRGSREEAEADAALVLAGLRTGRAVRRAVVMPGWGNV